MNGTLHIVGAGISGMAAALLAGRAGWRTELHEATRQAGGRCRTIERAGIRHDNGTHVLFAANRVTLHLLDLIGARSQWVEPEPDGLPVVDLAQALSSRVALSPWSWGSATRRPPGISLADLRHLLPLLLATGEDREVASYAGGSAGLAKLLELMTVAILNTPLETASARRLGRVFRRMLRPGAARLLVASSGLGPDLIEPLERAATRTAEIRFGRRLKSVVRDHGSATALQFAGERIILGEADRVILALPPQAAGAVLPSLSVPSQFEPIVNLHVPHKGDGPIRFIGMTGGLAQWMLVRPGMASVTISAASDVVDCSAGELAERLLPEVLAAARYCGVALSGASAKRAVVIKERLATPLQDCALERSPRPLLQPLDNLYLAGDWTGDLPATIEAAVVSAQMAIDQVKRPDTRRSHGAARSERSTRRLLRTR